MSRRRLALVDQPTAEPIDITAKLRAEIAARDWACVHIRGDRSAPVDIPERRGRTWR